MTPDKVEAALASLKQVSAAIACPDLPRRTRADESRWATTITDALSVLTEALAESRRDAARYRWLRDASHDWDVYYPTDKNASGIGAWFGCTDRDGVIDLAMKDTDHAR